MSLCLTKLNTNVTGPILQKYIIYGMKMWVYVLLQHVQVSTKDKHYKQTTRNCKECLPKPS